MSTLDLVAYNSGVALIMLAGLLALLKLGWADRWHHLYFALFAFVLPGAPEWEFWLRCAFAVVTLDDAIQHVVQWEQWYQYRRLLRNAPTYPPDEGTGWPNIYRSPLHLAYWWVVTHV